MLPYRRLISGVHLSLQPSFDQKVTAPAKNPKNIPKLERIYSPYSKVSLSPGVSWQWNMSEKPPKGGAQNRSPHIRLSLVCKGRQWSTLVQFKELYLEVFLLQTGSTFT